MSNYKDNSNPNYIWFGYDKNNVNPCYRVVGIVFMKNGCCEDQPVLITENNHPNPKIKKNYSCQCGCGAWCTTGHPTPVGALKDYETMSNNGKPVDGNYNKICD